MNHQEIALALNFIRPNAEWSLTDNELTWLDAEQTEPTKKEIEAGWAAYQAKVEADKAAAENQKQAILDRLGLTAEEAKLLLA